jgi:hypothetical protein
LQAITVATVNSTYDVRLDGEQGEANAGGRAGCTRARSAAQFATAGGAVRQGVLRQAALVPEGDAGAVGARVVAQLQMHRVDVRVRWNMCPKATPSQ